MNEIKILLLIIQIIIIISKCINFTIKKKFIIIYLLLSYFLSDFFYMMVTHLTLDNKFSIDIPLLKNFAAEFQKHHNLDELKKDYSKFNLELVVKHNFNLLKYMYFNIILFKIIFNKNLDDSIFCLFCLFALIHNTAHILCHYRNHNNKILPKFIKKLQDHKILVHNSHKIHHKKLNTNFAFTELTNFLIGDNGLFGNFQYHFQKDIFYPIWLFMFLGGSTLFLCKIEDMIKK